MVDVETELADTATATVRVPANLMSYIRASYDTREKVLDWMLALGVVLSLAYVFRDELKGLVGSNMGDPNTGRADEPQPNQNIGSAFPMAGTDGGRWPGLYAYNMPPSRDIRYSAGPSATKVPDNPSIPANYDPAT